MNEIRVHFHTLIENKSWKILKQELNGASTTANSRGFRGAKQNRSANFIQPSTFNILKPKHIFL